MLQYPFEPYSIGNLCLQCCGNCRNMLQDSDARCCRVSPGLGLECYRPRDCKTCKNTPTPNNPDAKKVVNYCSDPEGEYFLEGKTSCCFGECYDNRCYDCTRVDGTGTGYYGNSKVSPKFDPDIEGCCNGIIFSKLECKQCVNNIIITTCNDPSKSTCCIGSGDCYDATDSGCLSCQHLDPPENKKTKKVKNKCADDDENPDCCGGTCWNSIKNKCKICENYNLINKPGCGECCGPNNNQESKCCEQGKICCKITYECFDPKCEECA